MKDKPLSEKREDLFREFPDTPLRGVQEIIKKQDKEAVERLKEGCIICGKKLISGKGRHNKSQMCNRCYGLCRSKITEMRLLNFKKIDKIFGRFDTKEARDDT